MTVDPSSPRRGPVDTVVSGGQTGVDRAALDVAIELGIPYAGWCPRDGWAEDLAQPPGLLDAYPLLTATRTRDPAERTRRNVRGSDATLVVTREPVVSAGVELTRETARDLDRPCLVCAPGDSERVRSWLDELGPALVLNVSGPRESEWPGAYAAARDLLHQVLTLSAETS